MSQATHAFFIINITLTNDKSRTNDRFLIHFRQKYQFRIRIASRVD
jgi:hypothetical protein